MAGHLKPTSTLGVSACRVADVKIIVAGSPHGGSQDNERRNTVRCQRPRCSGVAREFPYNGIITLLDVNRPFNLAESTSQDLTLGELLDMAGLESIRDLKIGYGSSAGSIELREEIAKACNVPVDQIITTQGTALGLFLLAFGVCRPGDEAVLATPCFPPSRDSLVGAGVSVREIKLSCHRDGVLASRRRLLAQELGELAAWCESEHERIEWIRPDAGALCCLRLRSEAFDDAAVSRFWSLLPRHDLQLASGDRFGETDRVFRLGFGYLPPERLGPALSALSSALDAAIAPTSAG